MIAAPGAARPILIAGPTASGKSALALALAERLGGCVINADALQVYDGWRILTARPSEADEARAPHRLYGHIPVTASHSVGAWLRDARDALGECAERGWRPIIVGGTGLCFRVLTEGLAEIPPPCPRVRTEAAALLAELGRTEFAARLRARDPATMASLDAANPARLLRAWETLETTGQGLAAWHARTPAPLLPLDRCAAFSLLPDRAALYARCDARFAAMLRAGALDEARAVAARGPSPAALKALGARELIAHIAGEMSLEDAAQRARIATRNYAKRQMTWLRNQMISWVRIETQETCGILRSAIDYLSETG